MIWKDVVGFEGLYKVSSTGIVKSLDRTVCYNRDGKEIVSKRKGKIMDGTLSHGYLHANLSIASNSYKTCRIHRLICEAFHGPAPIDKPFVNHKNGVKTDNRADNLEWCSHSENIQHAIDRGLTPRPTGEANPAATLTDAQVSEVSDLLDNSDLTLKELADKFNTTVTVISYIKTGRTWDHLTHRSSRRIAPDMRVGKSNSNAKSVVNCRGEVFDTVRDASRAYGLDSSSITRACRGRAKSSGAYADGTRIKWKYNLQQLPSHSALGMVIKRGFVS